MTVKAHNISGFIRKIRNSSSATSGKDVPDPKKGYLLFKRSFDILLAILFITGILSWLLPLMAILIKWDSRGPVFFLQKRVGKGGREFTCYKLRTMVVNRQADECPATEDDVRITRLGRILRKSHLDELPQLFNVLLGSMSIVGPRPYMPADCQKFSTMIPGHDYRNFVKPGITGLAQVKGLHGPKTDFKTIFWRYQWDAFYVRNADFLLDLRILRRTILFFFTQPLPLCG
ncbi:MAG TPA: sugar transferase [Puia sp.]|jgi:putative colanic acid biosynthesis UDP-glucose lipid carrier transferase|nr:sugar transferase [Puia sp.]